MAVPPYFDDIGADFFWDKVKEYADGKSEVGTARYRPAPRCVFSISDDAMSAVISIRNTFTGYGNVVLKCRNGSAPTDSDAAEEGMDITVTEGGSYYVRAFSSDGAYLPSACSIVTIEKCAAPVISAV